MSQISKRNRNAAKLAFAGVGMITLPLFTLTDASADAVNGSTVIYGNSNAGGSTKITNNADVPDAGAVTTLNSSIRNLQVESNGIIHISPVPTTITKAELAATQAKVNQLVQLVQTYNQNKAQLNAQDNTMESFTGKKAVDTYTKIDGSNLDNALSQMQSINSQMSGMVNDNRSTVNKTAQDSATRTTLDDAVKSANQQITNASGSVKEAQDGIYGNMDDVKRKSYDSSQQDGVKVDNNQTQQVNTVKTNVQPVQYTKVSSVSDINNALNNILNNVKNQTVDINNQTKYAGDYKDNALHNIDDVNQWLNSERNIGQNAKITIVNNTNNALNELNQKKQEAIQIMEGLYASVDNQTSPLVDSVRAKLKQQIDSAVDTVKSSIVTTNQLPDISMANPVNFGDIGRKEDDDNNGTNGSITNTKNTQANSYQDQINDTLTKQSQSIDASNKNAQDVKDWNQQQITDYLNQITTAVNMGNQANATLSSNTNSALTALNNQKNATIQALQNVLNNVKNQSSNLSSDSINEITNQVNTAINTINGSNITVNQLNDITGANDLTDYQNQINNMLNNQAQSISDANKTAQDVTNWNQQQITDYVQRVSNLISLGNISIEQFKTNVDNAVAALNKQKASLITALNSAYDKIKTQSNNLPADTLAQVKTQIDAAIAKVNTTKISTKQLATITPSGDVNTYKAQIQDALNKQTANIKKVTDAANAVVADDKDNIDDFVKTMSTGGVFPQSYLDKMSIYNSDDGLYKKYIDSVLHTNYSSDEIQKIASQLETHSVSSVPNGTPVVKVATALYLNHQKEIGKGFGSVMFKSTNLNDMDIKVNAPGLILDSRDSGGTQGIYDFFKYHTLGNSTGHWTDFAAVRNLEDTINAPDGQKTSITFVTSRPGMAIKIPDAFVSLDANGKVETHDLNVSATMTAYNGTSLINGIHDTYKSIASSGGHPTFIYTFYIDKYTGQLVVTTGYIITQGAAVGSGPGGTVSASSGGEEQPQMLNSNTSINGSLRIMNNTDTAITNNWSNTALGRTYGDGLTSGPSYEVGQLWGTQNANLYKGGLAQTVKFSVDSGGSYAANAPLYVSDIDDGQQLITHVGDSDGTTNVVTGDGNTGDKVTRWESPFSGDDKGKTISFSASEGSNQDSNTVTTTNINKYSAFIYKLGTGLNNMRVTLRSLSDHGDNYQNISTSFFAPFGVLPSVPTPSPIDIKPINAEISTVDIKSLPLPEPMNIKPINASINTGKVTGIPAPKDISAQAMKAIVDTADVVRPTAVAHTEGSYTINANPMYIQNGAKPEGSVKNMSAYLDLPTYDGVKPTTMITASNDSLVVRRSQLTVRKTASGNSLVIRYTNTPRLTASGNSLVIRNAARNRLTASGNSLVVTGYSTGIETSKGTTPVVSSLSSTGLVSVDANGNLVMNSLDNPMTTSPVADKIISNSPMVTANADGTHTVAMSVYVDSAIQSVAQQALDDWKKALAAKGVILNANITTNIADLKQGVALAILNSNNSDVRADSQSGQDNLNQIGGLTTKGVYTNLNAYNGKAKFNADGTVTAGDALKNAGTVIQLNNQGITSYQNYLGKTAMNVGILKHEIGHSFGLQHIQGDSLMTPGAGNSTFTGQISDADATLAARNLTNPAYRNSAQTTIINKKLNLTQAPSSDSYQSNTQRRDDDFGTVNSDSGEVDA